MRHIALVALFAGLAAAQPVVQSIETTNTQAVIRFTIPPGTTSCTVEISEESDYTPLVHDVNTSLFAGADACGRATSLVSGTQIVFVAGRRTIDMLTVGSERRGYSRALQAATRHYYRITADAQTATGTFETQTVPFGNLYSDDFIPDPDNVGQPKRIWFDQTQRNFTVIDPHTGVQVRTVGIRTDWTNGGVDGTPQTLVAGNSWTNASNLNSTTPGTDAECTGGSCGMLIFERSLVSTAIRQQVYTYQIRFRVTGWGDDATAANRQVEVCLIPRNTGVCDAHTAAYKATLTLPQGSGAEAEVILPGDILFRWYGNGMPWYLDGSDNLGLQFGLRKTTSTGTVHVRAIKTGYDAYFSSSMSSSGAARRCNPNVRSDGRYLCMVMLSGQSANRFYLIHATTGEVTWIGRLEWLPDVGSTMCSPDTTHIPWHPTDPDKFYCLTSVGRVGLLTYVGTGTEKASNYTWNSGTDYNLTWVVDGTLNTKLNDFYTAHASEWTPILGASNEHNGFSTSLCSRGERFNVAGGYILGKHNCGSTQDAPWWSWAIRESDMTVVAMNPGHAAAPTRWCSVHTPELVNEAVIASTLKFGGYRSALAAGIDGTQTTIELTSTCSSGTCTGFRTGEPVRYDGTYLLDFLMRIKPGDRLAIAGADVVVVTSVANFPTISVTRGTGATSASAGALVTPVCASWAGSGAEATTNGNSGYRQIWDFLTDPYGVSLDGSGIWGVNYYGHPDWSENAITSISRYSDNRSWWRTSGIGFFLNARTPTSLSPPNAMGMWSGMGFGGAIGNDYGLGAQTHASIANDRQEGIGAYASYDAHPFGGGQYFGATNGISAVAGFSNVYKYLPAGDTPLKYKHMRMFGITDRYLLRDISGPSSAMSDSNPFEVCYAVLAGECVAGSSAGDIYFSTSATTTIQSNSCFSGEQYNGVRDACIANATWMLAGSSRVLANLPFKRRWSIPPSPGGSHPNPPGGVFGAEFVQILTRHATLYMHRGMSAFAHIKPFSNGRFALAELSAVGETGLVKLPPIKLDEINRSEFQPVAVQVPATPGVNNVVIEFGYADDADANQFRCTRRAESCLAYQSTVNRTTPFAFASEAPAGVSCASGCTVTIPAYPVRVLFYRIAYRDASNNVLWRGTTQVQAVF